MDITRICAMQRAYFEKGETKNVGFRIAQLKKLQVAIRAQEKLLLDALQADLGKSGFEGYMSEVGMVLEELAYMLHHVRRFARARAVPTPLAQGIAASRVLAKPYGNVLIMSPWNYPLLLTIGPLVDALAAGNTAVVKPSAYSPNVSHAIAKLLGDTFAPEYVAVIEGGRNENTALLEEKFDYIFFTGSKTVGRLVMKKAARHLTPVTLELGGKSPCIVDETANIAWAARRIVFGKYLNCGQTCVAPDYVLVHARVHDVLIAAMKREIVRQFGEKPLDNPNYGKIVNQKHFERLCALMTDEKDVFGGETNAQQLRIAPTLRRIAENQVVNAASDAIFRAVTRQLQTGSVDYSRIIGLEKDETGRIAALTTDMQQVAKLKSEVLAFLDEEISNMDDEALSVPVGSLLFPTFFAGRGFSIPVRVLALNSTNADFYSSIESVGINQSVQQIRITFTISLSFLTPVGISDTDVTSDVLAAQTILLGDVPESYLYLG